MKVSKHIRRIIAVLLWCIAGAGILVLLLAAMRTKGETNCQGLNIEINGSSAGIWFIDKADINNMITSNGEMPVKGRRIKEFDLIRLEQKIEKDVWILDAELFFDNNNYLQVDITEREPIARLFTSQGSSFYIDSALVRLPLSAKMSAKLPVFTGFPSELTRRSKADSSLLNDIRLMSRYIQKNSFWMAQITQVHINARREFELVPMIGSHTIEFGDVTKLEEKFARLMIFYREVFAKTGMERYDVLKLQYADQVVGVRNPKYTNKADSVQAIKTVEKLIASTYDEYAPIEGDTSTIDNNAPAVDKPANPNPPKSTVPAAKSAKSNPEKPRVVHQSKPVETNLKKPVPKAVMPRKG